MTSWLSEKKKPSRSADPSNKAILNAKEAIKGLHPCVGHWQTMPCGTQSLHHRSSDLLSGLMYSRLQCSAESIPHQTQDPDGDRATRRAMPA